MRSHSNSLDNFSFFSHWIFLFFSLLAFYFNFHINSLPPFGIGEKSQSAMFCASQLFAHSFSRFFRIRMRFFLQFFLARFALVTLFSSIFYYFAFTSPLFYYSISAIFAAFTTIGPMMMMMDFFRQKLSVSGTWSRYWNLLIVSAHFNETFLFKFSVFVPLARNASQGGATVEPRFFSSLFSDEPRTSNSKISLMSRTFQLRFYASTVCFLCTPENQNDL